MKLEQTPVLRRRRRPGERLRLPRRRRARNAGSTWSRCSSSATTRCSRSRPGGEALLAEGTRVHAVVDWAARFPTMANHTATHLLHAALREVLGDHVKQAGSAVRPDKLRFDFSHPQPLTAEERERVERLVNEKVFEAIPVRTFVTPIEEARKLGAMMLFGEKYGDEVRVVEIDGFSRELCGGTHVRSTAEIGPFVITQRGARSAPARGGSRPSPPARPGRSCTAARASSTRRAPSSSRPGARRRSRGKAEHAGRRRARRRGRRRDERDRHGGRGASTPTRCSTSPTASSSGARRRRSCSARARTATVHLVANFDEGVVEADLGRRRREGDRADRRRRRRRPADDGPRRRQEPGGARRRARTGAGADRRRALA